MAQPLDKLDPANPEHATHDSGSLLKKVWVPFLILLGITVAEFIIALAIPNQVLPHRPWKVLIYALLTVAKAFYIVAYFMHLKFERLNLIYSIVVPVLFIVVLVAALIFEGAELNNY